ncbi:MAG: carbohydrate porin [Acidobacteriota bacterium]|nr:carbohydrate porin [Acidobacteriota bacterium]
MPHSQTVLQAESGAAAPTAPLAQGRVVKSALARNVLTFLMVFGPGLIVMEADNDAGAVSTYTQAGAQYGSLLWLLLLLLPITYFIQEMVVRLGIAPLPDRDCDPAGLPRRGPAMSERGGAHMTTFHRFRVPMIRCVLALAALAAGGAWPCGAEEPPAPPAEESAPLATPVPAWLPRLLGAQFTFIGQRVLPFSAAYSGPRSLVRKGDTEQTDTYGLYFGSQLAERLQFYFDVEMARGRGISNASGLGGITNGDVIRQGSVDLGMNPYVARAYLRYVIPLSKETEPVEHGLDRFPSPQPTSRFEVKLGKLALPDDIDVNRYANTTRTQFMNWGLFNNTAWDYAADTRGYSNGLYLGLIHPRWALRLASFQMPTLANGNVFDRGVGHARGDNLELTLSPHPDGAILRLLLFYNQGRMGSYRAAVQLARERGGTPDIVANDRPGRTKKGWGVNLEQPLADRGETGAFLRLGWNDGRNEDFVFTEVDRHASAGVQVAGSRWGREKDRAGLGVVIHGLSNDHRLYLENGGLGFLLGDGRLRYGHEEILETYYRLEVCDHVQIGPDFQHVVNPGFNRDRGPATVLALRLHLEY